MAINKVVYGNSTIIDITDTTATAADVAEGKYFYNNAGVRTVGTASQSTMSVVETQDSHGGTIVEITGDVVTLQSKTATPTTSTQTIAPDSGYTGLSEVVVNPIPSQYIVPSGTKSITANGTGIDVTAYASVDVAVPASAVSLQDKTVTPTTAQQTVTADTGYDGLGTVTVSAMPSGAASTPATTITATPSISVSASGLITATASASQSITPTVSAGYVASGTAGTVTVSGSNTQRLTTMAAQTVTPTTASQTVSTSGKYMTGDVTVNAIPAEYITTTDATASASDIVSGETAYVNGSKLTGTLVIQHYYTGSSAPSSSTGANGDIYLQTT